MLFKLQEYKLIAFKKESPKQRMSVRTFRSSSFIFQKQRPQFEPSNVFCQVVSVNEKQVICSITISNARNSKKVVQILGACFTGVPVANLSKKLSKLEPTKLSSLTTNDHVCLDDGRKVSASSVPDSNRTYNTTSA